MKENAKVRLQVLKLTLIRTDLFDLMISMLKANNCL